MALYPRILDDNLDMGRLIQSVAPGRPCSHRPMKKIIAEIKKDKPTDKGQQRKARRERRATTISDMEG
jgi:hypothetical protein